MDSLNPAWLLYYLFLFLGILIYIYKNIYKFLFWWKSYDDDERGERELSFFFCECVQRAAYYRHHVFCGVCDSCFYLRESGWRPWRAGMLMPPLHFDCLQLSVGPHHHPGRFQHFIWNQFFNAGQICLRYIYIFIPSNMSACFDLLLNTW